MPEETALLAALAALALLADADTLAALQRMAGYTTGRTFFGDAKEYLDTLIPLAAIGLTGGGVAYMVGRP
jgi:hypothetical protein